MQCLQRIRYGSFSKICYVQKARCSTVHSIPYSLVYWEGLLGTHIHTSLYVHLIAMETDTGHLMVFSSIMEREMSSQGEDGRETFHCMFFIHSVLCMCQK